MSVLVNGMQMPEHCAECPCMEGECLRCLVTGKLVGGTTEINCYGPRPKDCPLVAIPDRGYVIILNGEVIESSGPTVLTEEAYARSHDAGDTPSQSAEDINVPSKVYEKPKKLPNKNPCNCGSSRSRLIRCQTVNEFTRYKVRCVDCGWETTLRIDQEDAIFKWNARNRGKE